MEFLREARGRARFVGGAGSPGAFCRDGLVGGAASVKTRHRAPGPPSRGRDSSASAVSAAAERQRLVRVH